MAKRYLLNALLHTLGEFIELDEKDLNLGFAVWSGQIVLRNLKLKANKLFREFHVSIVHGSLDYLEINIPWTALLNSPVKIKIDGVYLQISPLDVAAMDKEETRKRMMEAKLRKLSDADKLFDESEETEDAAAAAFDSDIDKDIRESMGKPAKKTYVQQLTAKIVDNLEFTLNNIHARYEDSKTVPGRTFAAGVTLDSFTIATCDANWKESFMSRKSDAMKTVVRKLLKILNVGLYWNTKTGGIAGLPFDQWKTVMKSMVYSGQNTTVFEQPYIPRSSSHPQMQSSSQLSAAEITGLNSPHVPRQQYIIAPPNVLTIKLTHIEGEREESEPRFDVLLEGSRLDLTIDRLQYCQLFLAMETISDVQQQKQPLSYRPKVRPVNRDGVIAWWKYSFKLIRTRKRYVYLVKKSKEIDEETGWPDARSKLEEKEMEILEERIPLTTLILFRHLAATERKRERKRATEELRRMQLGESSIPTGLQSPPMVVQSTSWFGFWSTAPTDVIKDRKLSIESKNSDSATSHIGEERKDSMEGDIDEEGDVSIASIISRFEEDEKAAKETTLAPQAQYFKLSLASSASLELAHFGTPVCRISMALSFDCLATGGGFTATAALKDLLIQDRITENAAITDILRVRQLEGLVDSSESDLTPESGPKTPAEMLTKLRRRAASHESADGGEFVITKPPGSPFRPISPPGSQVEDGEKADATNLDAAASESIHGIPDVSPGSEVQPLGSKSTSPAGDDHDTSAPAFVVKFQLGGGKSCFRIKTLPLEICLNKECVRRVVHMFMSPSSLKRTEQSVKTKKRYNALKNIAMRFRRPTIDSPVAEVFNPQQLSNFEFLFEAHAPKIIVPENSSMDAGYLLLDTGYLQVRGLMGDEGMAWDVSLKDANAGLPLLARDLYSLNKQSLYLIKPFSIGALYQTIDKTECEMSLDVVVTPELRGELDAKKLARLLLCTKQITANFSPKTDAEALEEYFMVRGVEPEVAKSLSEPMNMSAKGASVPISPTRQACRIRLEALTLGEDKARVENILYNQSLINADTEGSSKEDLDIPPGLIESLIKDTDASRLMLFGEEKPATLVSTLIVVNIPTVALDLTYDVANGQKLILSSDNFSLRVIRRMHDMQVCITMGSIALNDTMRCEAQRSMIWTPVDNINLIDVRYMSMYNRKSPLYKQHATEIHVDFPNVNLSTDAQTISHLKPFMEVLLSREKADEPTPPSKPPTTPGVHVTSVPKNGTANGSTSTTSILAKKVTGMLLTIKFREISFGLLREVPNQAAGQELQKAFTLDMKDFVLTVNMMDMMSSDVKVRSIEAVDNRDMCKDYVFKKILFPYVSGGEAPSVNVNGMRYNKSIDNVSSLSSMSEASEPLSPKRSRRSPMLITDVPRPSSQAADYEDKDMLHVTYKQESSNLSFISTDLSNVTMHFSWDTMLDLAFVFMANFFAIIDLLRTSKPAPIAPTAPVSPQSTPREVGITLDMLPSLSDLQKEPSSLAKPSSFYNARNKFDTEVGDKQLGKAVSQALSPAKPVEVPKDVYTYNVAVSVHNPRIVILDDPTTQESRAIVSQCAIEVHYTRESTTYPQTPDSGRELLESLHLSMKENEMLVVSNMLYWSPQPILEPMGLDFHLRRKTVDGVLLSSIMNLDMDSVRARLSINDMGLIYSIMTRKGPETNKPQKVPARASPDPQVSLKSSTLQGSADSEKDASPGLQKVELADAEKPTGGGYSVSINLGTVSIVTINDFNGQNLPIIRALLDGTTFFAEASSGGSLRGDGSLIASAEFYNPRLSVWEPVLDRWHPELTVTTFGRGMNCEIRSDHTMQLTVSGIMLEQVLQTHSLFIRQEDAYDREAVPEIVISNQLGEEIEIFDSLTSRKLLSLDGIDSDALPEILNINSMSSWAQSVHTPGAVDVHLIGQIGAHRLPIFHLPFNTRKPRVCILQIREDIQYSMSGDGDENEMQFKDIKKRLSTFKGSTPGRRKVLMEPIVEEAYENQRYDPITGNWKAPFILGDPSEWTDASGTVSRDIKKLIISSDKWEWLDDWSVDMDGIIGVNFDDEGWEYGSGFSKFSIASRRRTLQSMDCCRRRRWTRTRVPTAANVDDRTRPLSIVWDVQSLSTGTLRVDIRSRLQIANTMPFSVMVSLKSTAWRYEELIGPISEGKVFNVPLALSYASSLKVKPATATVSHQWSRPIQCTEQTYDYSSMRDIICDGNDSNGAEKHAACMRVITEQKNSTILITFKPYIHVTNHLPCALNFSVSNSDAKSEGGVLQPGSGRKLTNIGLKTVPFMKVQVGTYEWSKRRKIHVDTAEPILFDLRSAAGHLGIVISMIAAPLTHECINVVIYCKGVVIDRTGLKISVLSQRKEEEMIRNTFTPTTEGPVKFEQVTTRDKKARAKALKRAVKELKRKGYPVSMTASYPYATSAGAGSIGGTSTPSTDTFSLKSPDMSVIGSEDEEFNFSDVGGSEADLLEDQGKRQIGLDIDVPKAVERAHNHSTSPMADMQTSPDIRNFRVDSESAADYVITCTDIGDVVYSDMNITWAHLPVQLRNQTNIRTLYSDRFKRSRQLITFEVSQAAVVLVTIDMKVPFPPKWLREDNFRKIVQQGIARRIQKGRLEEHHYAIYGKFFSPGEVVCLRGNWCKEVGSMYSAFVLSATEFCDNTAESFAFTEVSPIRLQLEEFLNAPYVTTTLEKQIDQDDVKPEEILEAQDRIFDQVTYPIRYDRSMADRSWTDGAHGLSLFYAENDEISIGLKGGAAWSEDLNINLAKNAAQGSFEIIDWSNFRCYQLTYTSNFMPGLFSYTQQLVIMPRYSVVNCMDEPIFVAQMGSRESLKIEAYRSSSWHKSHAALGTSIQVRCGSSMWSLGAVDINEVGTSVLHLANRRGVAGDRPIVVHVEVKVAEPSDNCSVIVLIWQASIEGSMVYSIRNDSDVCITVKQAHLENHSVANTSTLYDVRVGPHDWVPFGWADPDAGDEVNIVVGRTLEGNRKRVATMSLMKAGEMLRLPDGSGRAGSQGEVVLSVMAEKRGRVLRIFRSMQAPVQRPGSPGYDNEESTQAVETSVFGLSFQMASLGVSLVLDKPVRREFLSLYIDGMEGRFKIKGSGMKSFEFLIMDLQIDNYSESSIYPILMYSVKRDIVASSESSSSLLIPELETPVIQFTVIQDTLPDTSMPIFKYVAGRALPFTVQIDSATLQLLYYDLFTDLKFLSTQQALAVSVPDKFIDEYNMQLLSPAHYVQSVDVYKAQLAVQANKMFFEKVVVHPVKITLSFVQAPFPRKLGKATFQSFSVNLLTSLAGIDRLELKLRSFEVDDAMETRRTLFQHISSRMKQDFQSQLAQVAGSLAVLGAPIGFARKVGRGVQAFFYEPLQGSVYGPHDFIAGLGKGTSILFSEVVAGAMNSVESLVGTASKGVSYLTLDNEYIRKRELLRQKHRARGGGVAVGLLEGGSNVVNGFVSGFSGLVTKPVEEAQKSGVKGFFRGIGLGLIGGIVKPVLGLTDGITSVATGIQNEVAETNMYKRVRPPRALEHSDLDSTDLLIVPLQLDAAYAQEFVNTRSRHHDFHDVFLNYIALDGVGEAIILSETYFYWRTATNLWGRTWANISHCFCVDDEIGVLLYSGADGRPEEVRIPCKSRSRAVKVYSALESNSGRMGNPPNVFPLDIVAQDGTMDQQEQRMDEKMPQRGRRATLSGELDGYRFGSMNLSKLTRITGPEEDVLTRATAHISQRSSSWKDLDRKCWQVIWEWQCTHTGINAARCCCAILINRSDSPIQIVRIMMQHGRNVLIIGSPETGYELDSRCVMPDGYVVVFIWAFVPSPIEGGHIVAEISSAAFNATLASTQRETACENRGGFSVGFLEKTVNDWWSKYTLLVT